MHPVKWHEDNDGDILGSCNGRTICTITDTIQNAKRCYSVVFLFGTFEDYYSYKPLLTTMNVVEKIFNHWRENNKVFFEGGA